MMIMLYSRFAQRILMFGTFFCLPFAAVAASATVDYRSQCPAGYAYNVVCTNVYPTRCSAICTRSTGLDTHFLATNYYASYYSQNSSSYSSCPSGSASQYYCYPDGCRTACIKGGGSLSNVQNTNGGAYSSASSQCPFGSAAHYYCYPDGCRTTCVGGGFRATSNYGGSSPTSEYSPSSSCPVGSALQYYCYQDGCRNVCIRPGFSLSNPQTYSAGQQQSPSSSYCPIGRNPQYYCYPDGCRTICL